MSKKLGVILLLIIGFVAFFYAGYRYHKTSVEPTLASPKRPMVMIEENIPSAQPIVPAPNAPAAPQVSDEKIVVKQTPQGEIVVKTGEKDGVKYRIVETRSHQALSGEQAKAVLKKIHAQQAQFQTQIHQQMNDAFRDFPNSQAIQKRMDETFQNMQELNKKFWKESEGQSK